MYRRNRALSIPTVLLATCLAVAANAQEASAQEASAQEASAQEPNAQEADRASVGKPPTVDQLKYWIESLQGELQAEKAALLEREKLHAAELITLQEQRSNAAERLLGAQVEQEQNGDRLKGLRERAEEATELAAKFAAAARTIPETFRTGAEQLRIHLNEIPGSEAAIDRLRSVSTELKWSKASRPTEADVEAIRGLLAEIESAHRDAMSVTLRPATIFTADGQREQVKLLSVGHVRFAYQTVEGGRIGLALASPREATGYRWSENLAPEDQQQMREAMASVEANATGLIGIPFDPTGRIGPDMLGRQQGLIERFKSGGLVMYPLAALALVALLMIAERSVVFYRDNRSDDSVTDKILEACRQGHFEQARDLCKRGRGAVCRVLSACLGRRELGQRAMEDSIQEQMLHEMPRLQRYMGAIAMLAAVAPLLGLLGTVTGIIRTFGVIRAFGNANPSLMAGGISEALMTTTAGLTIAVPILIVHSVLRGRSDRIVADTERHAANLLTTLVHGSSVGHPLSHPHSARGKRSSSGEHKHKPHVSTESGENSKQMKREITVD